MKPKVVLISVGLAGAIAFAQPGPREGGERRHADALPQECLERACSDACCMLADAGYQWLYAERERSPAEIYALEGLGAFSMAIPCACCGGVALAYVLDAPPASPNPAALAVAAVSAAALPLAAGLGAIHAGHRLREFGSKGWAIGGAYAGAVVGAGLAVAGFYLADRTGDYVVGLPFYTVGGLMVPVGAVVGYNSGVVREAGLYGPGFGGRLRLPALALTSAELPDHSVEYGVKVQVAGLKF
ncbi:hypothetical protein JXD38_11750 [candidate division WOR-3 bacterium]|nr:hypothetical protein [candidate division WOR-3 bacterium]